MKQARRDGQRVCEFREQYDCLHTEARLVVHLRRRSMCIAMDGGVRIASRRTSGAGTSMDDYSDMT